MGPSYPRLFVVVLVGGPLDGKLTTVEAERTGYSPAHLKVDYRGVRHMYGLRRLGGCAITPYHYLGHLPGEADSTSSAVVSLSVDLRENPVEAAAAVNVTPSPSGARPYPERDEKGPSAVP